MSDTQNKWVPVSERLPEVRHSKLVYTPGRGKDIAYLCEQNRWWVGGSGELHSVTHWMDLPEPPEPPKLADPFEAFWEANKETVFWRTSTRHAAMQVWSAAKEHYAKPKDYQRGLEDSVIAFESMVNRILEGKEDGTGKLEIPELEKLRHVLLERLKPLPDFETWAKAHCADGPYLEVEKGGRLINERAAKIVWNAAQGKPEA